MGSSDKVKVSIWPFVAIGAVLVVVLLGASIWNEVRTEDKLDKLRVHARVIYEAHRGELVDLVKAGSWKNLEGINDTEKGARQVYVIRKKEGVGWEILCGGREYLQNLNKMCTEENLDPSLVENLLRVVDMETTVSIRGEKIKGLIFGDRNLFAFVPIRGDGDFLGWMVVKMSQTREF